MPDACLAAAATASFAMARTTSSVVGASRMTAVFVPGVCAEIPRLGLDTPRRQVASTCVCVTANLDDHILIACARRRGEAFMLVDVR